MRVHRLRGPYRVKGAAIIQEPGPFCPSRCEELGIQSVSRRVLDRRIFGNIGFYRESKAWGTRIVWISVARISLIDRRTH